MKPIDIQQQKIAYLLKLISKNPNLEIVPMVKADCIQDDCYSSWMSVWGNARIDDYYCKDERVYFKSIDLYELVEELADSLSDEDDYKDLHYEELNKISETMVGGYEWIKAIVVNIEPN